MQVLKEGQEEDGMGYTEYGGGQGLREWWNQSRGAAATTTLPRGSSASRDLRTRRGVLGWTWVALVLEPLISNSWVRNLAHTTYHAIPSTCGYLTFTPTCLKGLQAEGGWRLWPKGCAGERLPTAPMSEQGRELHMCERQIYSLSGPQRA